MIYILNMHINTYVYRYIATVQKVAGIYIHMYMYTCIHRIYILNM